MRNGTDLSAAAAGDPVEVVVQRGLEEASLSGSCCGRTNPDLTSLVALIRWIGGIVSRRNTAADPR